MGASVSLWACLSVGQLMGGSVGLSFFLSVSQSVVGYLCLSIVCWSVDC